MSANTKSFAHPIRYLKQQFAEATAYAPSLRFSERRLLLALLDTAILSAALIFLALNSPSAFKLTMSDVWSNGRWFLIFWGLWLSLGFISGVYDLATAAAPFRSMWTAGSTALLTSSIYLLIPYLTPTLPDRRLYIFLFPLLTTAGVVLWRAFYATVFVQPAFRQRALVVGAGVAGQTLAQILTQSKGSPNHPNEGIGYEIIGFIDDAPAKQGQTVAGIPILGSRANLLNLVQNKRPHELVIAITDSQQIHTDLFQAILDCRELGVPITTMDSLYERISGRVPVDHAGRNLHVVLPVAQPVAHRLYLLLRRLFDMVIALAGISALALLLPFVWLANRLTAPGELFFRQERIGEAGELFQVIKFRSMVMDAEKLTGAVWATEDDPRITPVGRFLRKLRLDEIPQFINVLKGEMSLIGPRPERPSFVSQLAAEIPFYRVRHAVKPGITGWAQVMYPYGASTADARIKLEYDLYYIKHQSFYLDLKILLKTVQVVLGLKGR